MCLILNSEVPLSIENSSSQKMARLNSFQVLRQLLHILLHNNFGFMPIAFIITTLSDTMKISNNGLESKKL